MYKVQRDNKLGKSLEVVSSLVNIFIASTSLLNPFNCRNSDNEDHFLTNPSPNTHLIRFSSDHESQLSRTAQTKNGHRINT